MNWWKATQTVNDGRSRRESVSGIVWFAALCRVPIFLGEYLSFYFLMTFLNIVLKYTSAQSSLAWALYRVNSMMLSTFLTVVKPLPPSSPGDSHPAKLWPFAPVKHHFSFPFPKAHSNHSLLSASVFTALGTSHRWIHSTFPSRFTHESRFCRQSSASGSWAASTPIYCEWHCLFCIHMNLQTCLNLHFQFLWVPEAKCRWILGILYLIFRGTVISLSTVATTFDYSPTSKAHQGSSFSIMVLVFLVVVVWLVAYLKIDHSDGVWRTISSWFEFHDFFKNSLYGEATVSSGLFSLSSSSLLGLLGPPIQLWSTPPDWPPLGFHAPVFISCDLPGIFQFSLISRNKPFVHITILLFNLHLDQS